MSRRVPGVRPRVPDGRRFRDDERAFGSTWAVASSAPNASTPVPKERSGSPRTTGSPREPDDDLVVRSGQELELARPLEEKMLRVFGRSLKLRQVSAGGDNSAEADLNVLGTVVFDMGRFGIQFVASPRHADGIVITGPVSENMKEALIKTYEAVPEPKIVIAVGAAAISGGIFRGHPEVHDGA